MFQRFAFLIDLDIDQFQNISLSGYITQTLFGTSVSRFISLHLMGHFNQETPVFCQNSLTSHIKP